MIGCVILVIIRRTLNLVAEMTMVFVNKLYYFSSGNFFGLFFLYVPKTLNLIELITLLLLQEIYFIMGFFEYKFYWIFIEITLNKMWINFIFCCCRERRGCFDGRGAVAGVPVQEGGLRGPPEPDAAHAGWVLTHLFPQHITVDFTILILNKQAIFQNNSHSCTLNSTIKNYGPT